MAPGPTLEQRALVWPLAGLVAGAEQVLVTAAVPEDVPEALAGARFVVAGGEVTRDG